MSGNTGAIDRLAALVDQDHIAAPGVTSTSNATFAVERPWWFIGVRVVPAGASAVVGALHPLLGAIIALVAMSAALMIIGTAMFGSPELSRRAFRLIGNRPEPRIPSGEFAGSNGAQGLATPSGSTLDDVIHDGD
jgi:hypothetical protein